MPCSLSNLNPERRQLIGNVTVWKSLEYYNLSSHIVMTFFALILISMNVSDLSFPDFLPGLHIDELSRKKMDLTAKELSEEKELAYSCLS